jgi:DNA invertase Pin-like site-specific DNA recombinase
VRAALYVRVSTRDKGQNTANQLDHLREFFASNNWRFVREYQDTESGGKADRQEFRALLAVARARDFDVVLFWALDRFSGKDIWKTHQYLRQLDQSGVRFRSFTEPYLDSCGMFRDTVISILAVIARQERIRLSERVRSGMDRVKQKGSRSRRPVGRSRVILDRAVVVASREQGLSWSQTAERTGVSIGSVRRAFLAATLEGASERFREVRRSL